MSYKYKDVPGKVLHDGDPPTSTLVDAFQSQGENAAEAIVLRGYLGRSDLPKRTFAYLERAKRSEDVKDIEKTLGEAARARAWPAPPAAAAEGRERSPQEVLQHLIDKMKEIEKDAQPHIPWRLYLTPSLDSYVDFHLSSLIAYRREPRPERQDTCTVWLRVFEENGHMPIPYRVVQETLIGPSFAAYLGGDLIDDYLGGAGSSSAWGDQSSAFGGGRPGTGPTCGVFGGGRPGTGRRCAE